MTTLGAQLAALNSTSQGGSVLATSRRHEDAVGRGLHHSVQVGHALVGHKSHIFKASILYQDARQASNVPLTTIQENCVAALDRLATQVDPVFGDYIEKLCRSSTERGLLTKAENEAIDTSIQDLMYRLATRMTSKSADGVDTVTCGLNIVEYLIRQYDLYLRPKLVSTVLLVWLPHHEHSYFLRWLQLVDLANLPVWAWLRPYAIPNAKVGRDVIAKAASKNLALCRDLLLLSSKTAALPESDMTLSFTAAVLVEAMILQQRASGTMDERTCQAMLPTVRKACLSVAKNTLFANWGYVLASTILETSCLADEPRKGLVLSILQGITPSVKKGGDDHDDLPTNNQGIKPVAKETIQNALILTMSLLQQQPPIMDSYHEENDSKVSCQLAVGNDKALFGYANSSCIDSKNVWQALLGVDGIATRLADLLVLEGYVDVIHLVSSLWVTGWHRLEKNRAKPSHKHETLERFLTELISEPRLSSYLWSKAEWIEALVAFVLTNSKINNGEDQSKFLKTTLQTLRRKSITAYERGITQALLRSKRETRSKLAAFLGLTADADGKGDSNKENGPTLLLPPRVALEHTDVEIRLEAIDRLAAEQDDEGDDDNDVMEVDDEDETVPQILMRRVLLDEDIQVATKASKILCDIMDKKLKPKKTTISAAMANDGLQALYRWTEWSRADRKSKATILSQLLHFVVLSATKINHEENSELVVLLLEAIGAYLMHSDVDVAKAATQGILGLSGTKKGSKVTDKGARQVLLSQDSKVLHHFGRPNQTSSKMEQVLRRRLLPSLLKGYAETLSTRSKKNESHEKSKVALSYCLWVLSEHASNLSSEEGGMLREVLNETATFVAGDPNQLSATFASVLGVDDAVFAEVVTPFILNVCNMIKDKKGATVASLSVVLEMALRPTISNRSVQRLVAIAKQTAPLESASCHLAVVPALALLVNSEAEVRKQAVGLISVLEEQLVKFKELEWRDLALICKHVTENDSSVIMGSPSILSQSLQIAASKSSHVSQALLHAIICCMSSCSTTELSEAKKIPTHGWLHFADATGGHFATTTILVGLQDAGEDAFPLLERWSRIGEPLLEFVLRNDLSNKTSPGLLALLDHVTLMLKGQKVIHKSSSEGKNLNSSVIIMSGPAGSGGRKRSYSFGKTTASDFLSPFPKGMVEKIVSILSTDKMPRHVRNTLSEHVLCSSSWGSNIFSKLEGEESERIITTLLHAITQDLADVAEAAFFALPISCKEIAHFMDKKSKSDSSLAPLTYMADYVGTNAQRLSTESSIGDLLAAMFEKFLELTIKTSEVDEGTEFARTSILDALKAILDAVPTERGEKLALTKKKKFQTWINALVASIGSGKNSEYLPAHSIRNKKSVLAVLGSLCSFYPSRVTEELICATVTMVSAIIAPKDATVLPELLGSVVPLFLKYSSRASLSPSDLVFSFIGACNNDMDDSTRMHLYQGFIDAIGRTEQLQSTDLIGGFVACCIASDTFYANKIEGRSQSPYLVSQSLNKVSVEKRVRTLLTLVAYSRDFVLRIAGEQVEKSSEVITTDILCAVALVGPTREKRSTTQGGDILLELCTSFLRAISEVMASPVLAKYLRHCTADSSEIVVRLWQDLLLVQSICNSNLATQDANSAFWVSISEMTNETLESIHLHLPSPIFLAFATSLVKESESEDLRARALQLVAERSLMLDSTDPETCLFLDMLPYFTSLLDSEGPLASGPTLKQSALLAIEHITRKACCNKEGPGLKYLDSVSEALAKTARVIEILFQEIDLKKMKTSALDNSYVQLLCTATLCAATAVRACGARSIPSLPHLLKPTCHLLGKVNGQISSASPQSQGDESQSRIIQLSCLRLLSSVVETIPQFLSPYLSDLLKAEVLPLSTVRDTNDDQSLTVTAAATKLCDMMALKVPVRQLLAPMTHTLIQTRTVYGITVLLDIMTSCIKNSKPAEIGGKIDNILKAGTFVLDYSQDNENQDDLVNAATIMFKAFVLKLSEVQLRSLYTKLRAWRGEFDKAEPNVAASRRYCFWHLSATFALDLKSIFLPCLASVFTDGVHELEAAVMCLCRKSKVKTAGGTKKQRVEVDDDTMEYQAAAFRSLKALLKCLEASLRSDAHDGGSWIREGESERYDNLLEPLGKLFNCRMGTQTNAAMTYQDLVQGNDDESGSVVECIVALASAAGEEHKWKPLNHAVLQACCHDSRSEVRKAGVRCLLSLIKSIGEEYMVLIPECLPVLSELLEDSDEQIAGLAQECIAMSEELLGESLEDNLR